MSNLQILGRRTLGIFVNRIGTRQFAALGDLKKTLIHDEHVKDGGKMVDYAGYAMPVQYDKKGLPQTMSIIQSVKWTREQASLFDVSHMCSVRWTGKNAIDFVEYVTTADIHGLKVNTGGLSVIPNAKGGVIDDTMVSKVHTKEHGEHVYQVINAGCAPKDLAHFETELAKFDGDVKMEVLWDERGLFALQGPKAAAILQKLIPSIDVSKINFGDSFEANVEGANCLIMRCGYTGEDGFELFVPGTSAVSVWKTLRDQPEVRLAALAARDALRLEAGLCLYGHELDEDTSPSEAGLTWVVGKSRRGAGAKPFVGSERILAEIANKKLYTRLRAGLELGKGPPARDGSAIQTLDGEAVGVVTSGTLSPCLKKNISIGYIIKPFNKRGTKLQVVVRGKKYPATVVKMPFVPTKYYKA